MIELFIKDVSLINIVENCRFVYQRRIVDKHRKECRFDYQRRIVDKHRRELSICLPKTYR